MSLLDIPIARLDGTPATLGELTGGTPALLVNVASECGLTPQYAQLQELQQDLGPRGFTVVGVPCNQFGGQEPGSPAQIAAFAADRYGVTFPLTEKVEVNGQGRHPLYAALVTTADQDGRSGDIGWNFEKFLLSAEGAVVARFAPAVTPQDPSVIAAINAQLG